MKGEFPLKSMLLRAKNIVFLAIVLALVGFTGCATKLGKHQRLSPDAPRTVEQAVEALRTKWLSKSEQDWILRNPKDYVTATLHLPLGTAVRNEFGLWDQNPELLSSCGTSDPEHCSGIIFERLWQAVRAEADPELVHRLDCQFQLMELIKVRYKGFYKLRIGEILENMQQQINKQLTFIEPGAILGCDRILILRPTREVNLKCWSRIEFSEDNRDPVTLKLFLGWISWRNGFEIHHSPPYIELPFHEECSWPEAPAHFQPGSR